MLLLQYRRRRQVILLLCCFSQLTLPGRAQGLPGPDANEKTWAAIGITSTFGKFIHPLKIAIIDDGFDIDNPAWAAHIAHNAGEIPGNNIDDDHNGKTDDYQGWDFGDNDEDVRPARAVLDKESHGTRVLGLYWQALTRLAGGDPTGITILPIKAVSDVKLNNYLKEGYNGIAYAIEQKADLIICSWSGPSISPEERAILEKAREKGIPVIAAAGNFYSLQPLYPGAIAPVICVAAVDGGGRKLRTSNYGSFVDISAPGDSLLTFDPYTTTARAHISATSAATGVVAAVVTAIKALKSGLSPEAIDRLLKNTAQPLEEKNPLYAGNLGAGLIDVAAIRDALGITPAGKSLSVAPGASAPGNPMLYHQPKAYIDLKKLGATAPVRISPMGKYRQIKWILQDERKGAGPPDISVRARTYENGKSHDTILQGRQLKYPLLLRGDSVQLYRAANQTAHTGKTAYPAGKEAWWYYEVVTIDSSTLYCGGTVTEVNGTDGYIGDGSGDQHYTGRNDCKWQITVPAGKKIRLNFEQFDTEPKTDLVYIFNGNSTKDPILAIFSGHSLPPVIKSWGNTVLVWFLTNEENNFDGWKLHFQAVD